ncbi:phosphatase PAP2 family protein [Ramlibacter humi]|uniref:Phosphatase PAP2 family protein n=1 Tax=Ramlibacter humi TaxID=2530451 RepID=A0A4Z0BDE9_9BURK|nr:phosphatase PAP2 family protein [Ramlibacter humi]TFY96691.1 phosphatase PAP2 family protein [Ramlibacter humi]
MRIPFHALWHAMALAFLAALLLLMPASAWAQWRMLDQFDEREDSGIWSRRHQQQLDVLVITGVVGLAVMEGTETRLGLASWRAIDAALMTAATTEVMKRVFGRPRPSDNNDPDAWFKGGKNRSFPSGETAMMAAFVTPYIVEYREETPAIWALALLPAYMARARMKSQAHWLSDVVAGAAVGVACGIHATDRDTPLVLSITGRSAFVGLRHRF